ETLMLTFYGATLGKMVMKIKVVSVETGENPQLLNALLRFALPGVMGLIPIVGGLAALACWLSPLFDSSGRQQGWHDKVAKTVVIANS
ncbi:MAG: RDD family protein, partial [Dermabacter sp.]|nr:RDD family protein [Dermabacter sp.]